MEGQVRGWQAVFLALLLRPCPRGVGCKVGGGGDMWKDIKLDGRVVEEVWDVEWDGEWKVYQQGLGDHFCTYVPKAYVLVAEVNAGGAIQLPVAIVKHPPVEIDENYTSIIEFTPLHEDVIKKRCSSAVYEFVKKFANSAWKCKWK